MKISVKRVKMQVICFILAWYLSCVSLSSAYASPGEALEGMIDIITQNYLGEVDPDQLLNGALHGVSQSLDDYTQFYTEKEMNDFLNSMETSLKLFGLVYRADSGGNIYVEEVIENSAAQEAGIRSKDRIVKINSTPVSGMDTETIKNIMNERADNKAIMEIERDNVIRVITMESRETFYPSIKVKKIEELLPREKPRPSLRYMGIRVIGTGTANEFKNVLELIKSEGVTSIIIDLRGNSGGYLNEALEIGRMIVPEGSIVTQVNSNGTRVTFKSELKEPPFDKIIILVDENTASAAEILGSALQDTGAVAIGQRTYGKGVSQDIFQAEGVGYIKITTAEYLRRSGVKLDKAGITPNIAVTWPSLLKIKSQTDPEDILAVKEALQFCGYNIGLMNNLFDDSLKLAIKTFKLEKGLAENHKLDILTKYAINQALYDKITDSDLELERALEYYDSNK